MPLGRRWHVCADCVDDMFVLMILLCWWFYCVDWVGAVSNSVGCFWNTIVAGPAVIILT